MFLFWVMVLVSAITLLLLTLLGEWELAFRFDRAACEAEKVDGAKTGERGVRGFASQIPSRTELGPEKYCAVLRQRLTERFRHGAARYTFWSNYVFWLGSLCVSRLQKIENTEHLFRYSQRALCHQISQAMVDVATRVEIPARVVSLDGHVVVETYYDKAWHGFDPDYGVEYRCDDRVLSVAEVATQPDVARQIYRDQRFERSSEEVLGILVRNQPTYCQVGECLSPNTARFQQWTSGLKWLFPLAAIAVACWQLISGG